MHHNALLILEPHTREEEYRRKNTEEWGKKERSSSISHSIISSQGYHLVHFAFFS